MMIRNPDLNAAHPIILRIFNNDQPPTETYFEGLQTIHGKLSAIYHVLYMQGVHDTANPDMARDLLEVRVSVDPADRSVSVAVYDITAGSPVYFVGTGAPPGDPAYVLRDRKFVSMVNSLISQLAFKIEAKWKKENYSDFRNEDGSLRENAIRLAFAQPDLRSALLPLLK
jgi:hypothetical protein